MKNTLIDSCDLDFQHNYKIPSDIANFDEIIKSWEFSQWFKIYWNNILPIKLENINYYTLRYKWYWLEELFEHITKNKKVLNEYIYLKDWEEFREIKVYNDNIEIVELFKNKIKAIIFHFWNYINDDLIKERIKDYLLEKEWIDYDILIDINIIIDKWSYFFVEYELDFYLSGWKFKESLKIKKEDL